MLIAGGAYYIGEQVRNMASSQRNARYSWLYYSLVMGGLCLASLSMPVASLNLFWWKVADSIHQVNREEVGWPEMVKIVADIRANIPLGERSSPGILAGNYGEAGTVNVYGLAYNLPQAISGIDTFWLWRYGNPPPETVIVLGLTPSYAYSLFETCSIAGAIANPYGIQNEESQCHPDILLYHHLRQPLDQYWENFQYFG